MGKMRKDGTLKGMLIAGGDGCVGDSCGGRRISCSSPSQIHFVGCRHLLFRTEQSSFPCYLDALIESGRE